MNTMPFISVIIPAYKAAKYIEETVRSVLNQTYSHFELIIVDDGSPDDQYRIIERLCKEDSRIRYVKQENGGVSSARNHGFQLSTGSFIAFLDSDDVWLPDNLNKKLKKFTEDNELGLVHSDLEIIDEDSNLTGETKSGKAGYILDDLLAWNGTCIPTPSSILVKRNVVEKVGGFDLELSNAADQEFFFRVAKHFKIGRVEHITWRYRVHDNNMHSNIVVMERDALLSYKRAEENNLFKSRKFRNLCFSNMYMIMGATWWGDGRSKIRGIKFLIKAIWIRPAAITKVFRKIFH